MSAASQIVKKTFNKAFKKIAEEKGVNPETVQLGIYFVNGECKFKIYVNKQLIEKEVDLSKYLGIASFGLGMFIQTVGSAGPKYVAEVAEKVSNKVVTDDLNIILYYVPEEIPNAELRAFGSKQRDINITEEFLT